VSTGFTSGTSGTSGSSGRSGASSGTSGVSTGRTSGTSGTNGTSGRSGASSGTSGVSTGRTSGTSGSNGTSGRNGSSSGTSGISSTSGTSGTVGTSGISGDSGSAGTSGTTGTFGTSGVTATSGNSGRNGTSGTNGGTSGTSGVTRTSGVGGRNGTSGTNGGTSGTSGVTRTSGVGGRNGTSGTNAATAGTTGVTRTSGRSGANGSSGTTGTTGTSGVSFSGTSGISGGTFVNQPDYLVRTVGASLVQSVSFLYADTTNSRLGVGTTSPGRRLDVLEGNVQIVAEFRNTSTTSARIKFTDANTGAENVNIGAIGTRLAMWTNNTERVSILSGGFVGIGNTNPNVTLDVTGEIAIRGGESADDARMYFRASDNSNRFTIETDLAGITTDDVLGFRASATDNILVLKGNGNVGIATVNPQEKLHVAGTVRIDNEGTAPTDSDTPDITEIINNRDNPNVVLGVPDIWLRINVDGTNYVFPGYQEP